MSKEENNLKKPILIRTDQIYKIDCLISEGNPLPTIQWLHGTRPIEEIEEGSSLKINYTISGKLGETLNLIGLENSQQHYSCLVTNKVGVVSKDFFVEVQ